MDEHDAQDPNRSGVNEPDGNAAAQSPAAASTPEGASPDAMGAGSAALPTDENREAPVARPREADDAGTAPDFQQLQEHDAPGQAAPLSVLFDLDLP
ncbi:MAG: hypothetical protein OEO23_03575, partial [Gemmatimonadota bacterium]|nr:hypothetical protein [Gemmatimonadota bacterium]